MGWEVRSVCCMCWSVCCSMCCSFCCSVCNCMCCSVCCSDQEIWWRLVQSLGRGCSVCVAVCVALCVAAFVAGIESSHDTLCVNSRNVIQRVAVCGSALQCVVVCGRAYKGAWQCVTVSYIESVTHSHVEFVTNSHTQNTRARCNISSN